MIPVDFIALTLLWAFIIYARYEINEKIEGKSMRLRFIVPMYGLFATATILTTLHHIWEI